MATTDKNKRHTLLQRLTNKYRLVILNDETFEEVTSLRLSRFNVYILISTITVILVLVTSSAIIYTPLREYLVGSESFEARKDLMNLKLKSDSLQKAILSNDLYLENLKRIINGDLPVNNKSDDSTSTSETQRYDSLNISGASPSEQNFRQQVEKDQRFSVSGSNTNEVPGNTTKNSSGSNYFFPPLKGYVTQGFDPKQKHYGIDIVAPENEPVKATLDGIVVFAEWTAETGYVLAIQHANNYISLYKHNSVLLKSEGEFVKAGDVIAIIGNTGELTSGPHLHFELWYNGLPLDPKDYIALN